MLLKRYGILAILLFILPAFALPAFAVGPPLGSGQDETYYNGIWLIDITTYCHRHTDGGPVTLGTERLYMRVEFQGGTDYYGDLYPTLEDARNCNNFEGTWDFYFDYPGGVETYVINGDSYRWVDNPKFNGDCYSGIVGWLKTVVKTSPGYRIYNKMSGSGGGICDPYSPDDPSLACDIKAFGARWLEELPLPLCVPVIY